MPLVHISQRLRLLAILTIQMSLVAVIGATSSACGQSTFTESTVVPKGRLVIYSGRSESLVGPIVNKFIESSGIDVSIKYGKTPILTAALLEEGAKSPADVFFSQEPGGLETVSDMLSPLPTSMTQLVPEWAKPIDSRWIGISGRMRTIVYNTDNLSKTDLPTSLQEFTQEEWKGRIGWAPGNASFQTMVTAMRMLWGEDSTRKWLEGIHANMPRVYPKNTPIVAATGSGEIDVGFVNHYYLYRFIAEKGDTFPARNYYLPDAGPGNLMMVAGSGILNTAKNRENAEKFLQFLLSNSAQRYFANETYEFPLAKDIGFNPLLIKSQTPFSEVPNPTVPISSLSDVSGTQALLRDVGIIP